MNKSVTAFNKDTPQSNLLIHNLLTMFNVRDLLTSQNPINLIISPNQIPPLFKFFTPNTPPTFTHPSFLSRQIKIPQPYSKLQICNFSFNNSKSYKRNLIQSHDNQQPHSANGAKIPTPRIFPVIQSNLLIFPNHTLQQQHKSLQL